MNNNDSLRRLVAKSDIIELTHRVARAVDRNDVELFCAGFTNGGHFDAGMVAGAMPEVGRTMFAAIGDSLRRTQHVLSNHIIMIDGDTAKGEIYVTGTAFYDQDGVETELVFGGRYLDNYVLEGDAWKISYRRIVVDYARIQKSTHTNEGMYEATSYKGTKNKEDPSYKYIF